MEMKALSSDEKQKRLTHNLTSSISSLVQAVEIIADCWPDNRELLDRMVPLTKEKGQSVLAIWEELKEELRSSEKDN